MYWILSGAFEERNSVGRLVRNLTQGESFGNLASLDHPIAAMDKGTATISMSVQVRTTSVSASKNSDLLVVV